MDAELKAQEAQMKAAMESQRLEFDRYKAELDARTKIVVARIGATGELPPDVSVEGEPIPDPADVRHADMQATLLVTLQNLTAAVEEMRRPKTIVRGPDGRALGIQ
jgi:hypothetical protein